MIFKSMMGSSSVAWYIPKTDFSLFSAGTNVYGELGIGNETTTNLMTAVGADTWRELSCKNYFSHGIKSDGTLWAWGNNLDNAASPDFPLTQLFSWSQVSNGREHTLAIRSDGLLFAWGRNTYGQLGNGSSTLSLSPIQIGSASWSQVSANWDFSIGIQSDGSLWGWGYAETTNYANGTSSVKFSPVLIGGSSSWIQCSANYNSGHAIKSDGTLWGWGDNRYGTFGVESGIAPILSWKSVAHSGTYNGGVTTTGDLYLWPTKNPVLHSTTSWKSVCAAANTLFAIGNDDSLWGIGGAQGQLGNGTYGSTALVKIGNSSWSQVSGGGTNSMARRVDGTLWYSGSGGLSGNGPAVAVTSWTQVGALTTWSKHHTAGNHVLAIKTDGSLWSWGYNNYGALGDGTIVAKSSPVQIGASSWSQVSTGAYHSAAIRVDGTLWTWGYNTYGQLGNNSVANTSSPVQIGIGSSWTQVSCQDMYTLAQKSDGTIWAAGWNVYGQLGDGTKVNKSVLTQIGTSSWAFLGSNSQYQPVSSAFKADGTLWSWGYNGYLFGNNTSENTSSPVLIGGQKIYPLLYSSLTQVGTETYTKIVSSMASGLMAAISTSGNLYMWGQNTSYELGLGHTAISSSAVLVGAGSTWLDVSVGSNHTVAIKSDGTLWGWGTTVSGSFGNGIASVTYSSPVQIGTSSWTKVSCGHNATIVLRNDSKLFATGYNTFGQLALNTTTQISNFTQIGTSSWSMLPYRFFMSFASIRSDGLLFSAGRNDYGDLGQILQTTPGTIFTTVGNNKPLKSNVPTQVGTLSWNTVASGHAHTLAIRSDGLLFSWGSNGSGQLGDSTQINKSLLTQIGTLSWSKIDVGSSHSIAIRSDGLLFTWGNNSYGQLGDGTVTSKSSPVQIGTFSWSQVQAGFGHSLAIRSDGLLFSWGYNNSGQLGDLSTVNKSSPVLVSAPGGINFKKIKAGWHSNLAIATNNKLFSWGYNSNGELGDGTASYKSSPVQVGSKLWKDIDMGVNHSGGIRNNGYLFRWGLNNNSFGNGGAVAVNYSPVQVGTEKWSFLSLGWAYSIAGK